MLTMDRRQFIKALGITVAAACLPIPTLGAYPHFDPRCQYGDFVHVTDIIEAVENDPVLVQCKALFDDQIKASIPPEYRKYIQWVVLEPTPDYGDPLGQRGSVGWKYVPEGPRRAKIISKAGANKNA